MLPSNAISAAPYPAAFQAPDDTDTDSTQSFEYGGIAINDASHGRLYQVWRAWCDGLGAYVAPYPSLTPSTTLVSGSGISFVSIAFDSSMAPALVYVQGTTFRFRWYNTVTGSFQTDAFSDWTSARVCTDDKRTSQEGASDVILAYTRGDVLYWRQQRDRYTIERTVGPAGGRLLTRLGLNVGLRLQFELG